MIFLLLQIIFLLFQITSTNKQKLYTFTEESLPLLSDESFIPELHQELITQDGWSNPGLLACIQFAWSQALRSCSQWASSVASPEVLEDDESLLDMAVEAGVFAFMRSCVIDAQNFYNEVLLQLNL